jgi:hypothetical protein
MQSIKWEFDVTAFAPGDSTNEYIAGEAKATIKELDTFLANLEKCCTAGEHNYANEKPDRKNAHKNGWTETLSCAAFLGNWTGRGQPPIRSGVRSQRQDYVERGFTRETEIRIDKNDRYLRT